MTEDSQIIISLNKSFVICFFYQKTFNHYGYFGRYYVTRGGSPYRCVFNGEHENEIRVFYVGVSQLFTQLRGFSLWSL